MPDLPTEIWFHIAKHLPDGDVQRLRGLNPVFLELALNSRYKAVRLGPWFSEEHMKEIPRVLNHLSTPFISSRVQEVTLPLKPGLLEAPILPKSLQTIVKGAFGRIRPGGRRDRQPLRSSSSAPPGVDPQAIKLFSSLHNVHSLVLIEYISGDYPTPPIVSYSWTCLGTNLRELHIHARAQKAADLLESAPCLQHLEVLKLELKKDPYYLTPSMRSIGSSDVIPRFIRRVSGTLRQLNVVEPGGKKQLGCRLVACLVLRGVGNLPNLECFSFHVDYEPPRGSGDRAWPLLDFFEFLKANGTNLRHLSVPAIPPWFMPAPTQADPGFPPQLESFTLLPSMPPSAERDNFDTARAYASHSKHTLTSVRILDQHLSLPELKEMVSPL